MGQLVTEMADIHILFQKGEGFPGLQRSKAGVSGMDRVRGDFPEM